MKKTLIALAAMSAFGLAQAQSNASISGLVGFAYQSIDVIAAPGVLAGANRGLTQTDVVVSVAASETLADGVKIEAGLTLEAAAGNFASAMTRTDSFLQLGASFGTLRFDQTRTSNLLIKGMVAPSSLAETMYDSSGVIDRLPAEVMSYTSPEMGGLVGSLALVEAMNDGATLPGATAVVLGVNYAKGPLAAGMAYKSYTFDPVITGIVNPLRKSRLEAFATYDLGVAQLGVGYDGANVGTMVANAVDDAAAYALGVAVPMGAFTLGANWAKRNANTVSEFVVKYDLSKRTNLNWSFGKQSFDATPGTNLNGQQYRFALFHSF